MLSPLRPRLVSLEAFSGALLLALGLAPAGCESEVLREDGGGGSGGSSGASPIGPGPTSGPVGPSGATTGTGDTSASATGTGGSTSVGSGATGSGATGSSTAGSSSTGGGAGGCVDPQPVLDGGIDTGLDRCAGGQLRRRVSNACQADPPGEETCCGACPEGFFCSIQGEVGCSCVAACKTDAECPDGSLCFCGEPAGWCVQAGCQTGDDCAEGQDCTSWDPTLGCLYLEFACTTPADSCGGDLDCEGQLCAVQADGVRACTDGGCAIGRPFLVLGEARTAQAVARGDWQSDSMSPRAVDDDVRATLAAAWEQTARMEHASIAAFARFSLQLLALGAPADLLERTHRALADETRHARLAFAFAGAYRGAPIGPGPLSLGNALDGGEDVATFVRLLVREGCVGETVASLEAAECQAAAEDPAVRAVLATIADDEAAHAELAWRTARWMLDAFGAEARSALAAELTLVERELAAPPAPRPGPQDDALLRHGVATDAVRASFRRAALGRAIAPCLRALVAAEADARPVRRPSGELST